MGKELVTQVQEVQRAPGRINPRRNTLRHVLIQMTKIKVKKVLKAAREKPQRGFKGVSIRLSNDFSAEAL